MLALKSIGEILQMLGERLTAERLSQNITQRDLALRSGVAYSTLRKIESSGEGSMDNYIALLQALRLIEQIDLFLPPRQFDPELVHKMQGHERQRARRRK
jgi:transcriptional regulator with XRE-family HTH domain